LNPAPATVTAATSAAAMRSCGKCLAVASGTFPYVRHNNAHSIFPI
jgi:hypothetical protein